MQLSENLLLKLGLKKPNKTRKTRDVFCRPTFKTLRKIHKSGIQASRRGDPGLTCNFSINTVKKADNNKAVRLSC